MRQIKVLINFEELHEKIDKLPSEKRMELERKILDFTVKFLHEQEVDYCRKKDIKHKDIRRNYKLYVKMRNAINKRKKVRDMGNILMSFNPMGRNFIKF
tara:strand:- start:646 stop:942 length:297 start_codon:yes stop_codon:yes gene_type:complete